MPPYDILPAILGALFILTTGGVILLRPISKQLAQLLAQMASEKQRALEKDTYQVREMVSVLDSRLQLLEERLDFTERFLAPGARQREEGSE
jgi:cob(I)alamin adenosyltransferase